jgi:hypothetical protein
MSIKFSGPPCSVCGEPASGFVYLDNGAAANLGGPYTSTERRSDPRCPEHFPYDFGGQKEIAGLRAALQDLYDWGPGENAPPAAHAAWERAHATLHKAG